MKWTRRLSVALLPLVISACSSGSPPPVERDALGGTSTQPPIMSTQRATTTASLVPSTSLAVTNPSTECPVISAVDSSRFRGLSVEHEAELGRVAEVMRQLWPGGECTAPFTPEFGMNETCIWATQHPSELLVCIRYPFETSLPGPLITVTGPRDTGDRRALTEALALAVGLVLTPNKADALLLGRPAQWPQPISESCGALVRSFTVHRYNDAVYSYYEYAAC